MEKDTLSDDRDDFKLCLDAEAEQRKVSQADLEFALLDKQWSDADISARQEEGRPCLTINKLKAFGKQVTNDGRLNRPSINVKPVGSGATKETADIHSDLIRNIETMSQADIVYDTAFSFAVYGGIGYYRINVDYTCEDEWDQDISLSRINNPFSVYGDWESKEATSIDWNRAYVTDWYSKSAFEARWGKDRKSSSFEEGSSSDGDWFTTDKRIRVAERWLREEVPVKLLKLSNRSVMMEPEYLRNKEAFDVQGVFVEGERESRTYKVKQRLITGSEILEENDWLGKYIPIVPMYGEEVNINGKRHFRSLIHSAKDAQRMFNYWRTCSTELVALAPKTPFIGAVGQFVTDATKWQTANRTSHAYIEYDAVENAPPPQRQPFAGVPAGALQEALNASDDMKAIIGMYDASLGARSNETSGRAINARKQEGDTATYDFVDNRNRAVEHGGRIILDLIPKVYGVERIMRCVQEDGSTYTVPVNQPVVPAQASQQIMGGQPPQMDTQPSGPPEYVPAPPPEQIPPEMLDELRRITKVFDLTVGKYDVMVTAGPGFNTRREEASQQMMEFIRVFPQAAPLIGDLLAKNLDWPGSEQVAERLQAMLPPAAQGKISPIVAQLQQQLQAQDQHAKEAVQQLQQQIAEFQKQLSDKQAEQMRAYYAEQTKRMAEVADAAAKGFAVIPNPQNPQNPGDYVAMPIQPQTGLPQQPDPAMLIEANLKHRELGVKEKELSLKERQVDSAVNAETVNANAQQFLQVELPNQLMAQQAASTQAVLGALQMVAEKIEQKPERKTGRAVKQPDGTWLMESIAAPVEPIEPIAEVVEGGETDL